MKHTCEIEVPEGKRAEWINNVLTLVDESEADNRPVTERVKTFEDALNELGEHNQLVAAYRCHKDLADDDKDLVAYLKLRIIAAALNEGWKPKFTSDEYRWFPWFKLLTKEGLEDKTEKEWMKEHSLWLTVGSLHCGVNCGFVAAHSIGIWSSLDSRSSARLGVKSEELAVYFGKQFIDIWADYVLLGA